MAISTGRYRIHSAVGGEDPRYAQTNDGWLQLETLGATYDQQFDVTLMADGTYKIRSVSHGSDSGIWYQMTDDGVMALRVYDDGGAVRWKIQEAEGSTDVNAVNIIGVHGVSDAPLARTPFWNRRDSDDWGRIQFVDPGPADPTHNNWNFDPA